MPTRTEKNGGGRNADHSDESTQGSGQRVLDVVLNHAAEKHGENFVQDIEERRVINTIPLTSCTPALQTIERDTHQKEVLKRHEKNAYGLKYRAQTSHDEPWHC